MDWKKTALVTITRAKQSFIVVCFPFSTLEDESFWSLDGRILDRETKQFSDFNPSCLDVIQRFLSFSLFIFSSHLLLFSV